MEIETNRLILREWAKSDMADLLEGLNDLKAAKWLAFAPRPYTKKMQRVG